MKSSCSPVSSWPGLESSLCPAHPTSYSLSTIWVIERLLGDAVFVFKSPLVFVVMAPKRKSSDADNSDMPKRKVLPLTERVKVVGLRKEEKNSMLRLTRSSLHGIVKKVKKKLLVLPSCLKLQKLWVLCIINA